MVSRERIKNQAVMMGIETGDMPEVDYIWEVQRYEGRESCFGQGIGCVKTNCHWRESCLALSFHLLKGANSTAVNRDRKAPDRYILQKRNSHYPSLTESSLGKNS